MSASRMISSTSPLAVAPLPNDRFRFSAQAITVNVSSLSSSSVPRVSWSRMMPKCACAPVRVVSRQLQSLTSALRAHRLASMSNG